MSIFYLVSWEVITLSFRSHFFWKSDIFKIFKSQLSLSSTVRQSTVGYPLFSTVGYHRVDIKTPPLALTPLSNFLEILENNLTPFSTLDLAREAREKKIGFWAVLQGGNVF